MNKKLRMQIFSAGFVVAAILGISSANAVPILTPQVDFRDVEFSGADRQTSFASSFEGVGFTISASRLTDGGTEDALLWWDAVDGIGIRGGMQQDEIDSDEFLSITFDQVIGLSHIFLSDLFTGEQYSGVTYDETGAFNLDNTGNHAFTAWDLFGSDGEKSNGEATIVLSKTIPVQEIVLSARAWEETGHNYSVIGFTDPPIVPEPDTLLVFSLALGLLAVSRRWRNKKACA
jgi:hypothetical protein